MAKAKYDLEDRLLEYSVRVIKIVKMDQAYPKSAFGKSYFKGRRYFTGNRRACENFCDEHPDSREKSKSVEFIL